MDDFKLCSDGEFIPLSFPCPPPYSGPYYYYPYENIPLAPQQGNTDNFAVSSSKPLSSGAVAAIIIIVGFIFFIMCLLAVKFRTRFILSNLSRRNGRNNELSGEFLVHNGDIHLVNIVGCGLEEKLVNLLPVCEYAGLMKEGKVDGKERHECAVCLSLFEEKEIVRILPKCHHIFHLQCIDKWFESHANCPLCREKITLQTIQLSFNPDKHNNHDQLQPLDPPNIDFSHQYLDEQHVNSSPLRDSHLHNVNNQLDGSLACELQDADPQENNVVAAASATNCIISPHPAQAADQPNHRLIADDRKRKAAGFTSNLEGLCDQTIIPIPTATEESMKYQNDAGSKVDKTVSNKAAAIRDAYCININGVGQSAGPVCAPYHQQNPIDPSHGAADDWRRTARSQRESNNIGYFVNPNKSQEDHAGHIDDHKLLVSMTSSTYNPSTRSSSFLRKSLSTGSLFESDANKASHAFHGTTRQMLI